MSDGQEAAGPATGFGAAAIDTDPAAWDTDQDKLPDGLEVGVTVPVPGGVSTGTGVLAAAQNVAYKSMVLTGWR